MLQPPLLGSAGLQGGADTVCVEPAEEVGLQEEVLEEEVVEEVVLEEVVVVEELV